MPQICHTTRLAVEVVWCLGEEEQEPNDSDAREVDTAVPKDTEQGSPNALWRAFRLVGVARISYEYHRMIAVISL